MAVGKDIDYYSKFSPSPLSMKQFLDFGKKKLDIYLPTNVYTIRESAI